MGNKLIEIHDTNNWALNIHNPRNNKTGNITIHSEYTGEQESLSGNMKLVKTEAVLIKNVCSFTTKYLSTRHGTRWLNQDEAFTFLQNEEALIFIPSALGSEFVYSAKASGGVLTPEPIKFIENFTWGN